MSSPTSEMDSRDIVLQRTTKQHTLDGTHSYCLKAEHLHMHANMTLVRRVEMSSSKKEKVKTNQKLHVKKAPQFKENLSKKRLKSAEAGRPQVIFTQVYVFLVMLGSTSFHSE